MQIAYERESRGSGSVVETTSSDPVVTLGPPKTMKVKKAVRQQEIPQVERGVARVDRAQYQAAQTEKKEETRMKPRWGGSQDSSHEAGMPQGILQQMGINDLGPRSLLRRELNDEQDMLRKQVREQERIIGNLRAELDFSAESQTGRKILTRL